MCVPSKVVCNLGLRGDTVQRMIQRVEQVSMMEPESVFLMAGNLEYLDLYSQYAVDGLMPAEKTVDGLHLRPKGYSLWYSFLRQTISKVKLANHV